MIKCKKCDKPEMVGEPRHLCWFHYYEAIGKLRIYELRFKKLTATPSNGQSEEK